MGYYDKPVNRTDKAGSVRKVNDGFQKEIDKAKLADKDFMPSNASADEIGYMGVDDLDRLRREKLKHETK